MKKQIAISVVMPVYNGELYLKESIGSILDQTFNDFEFIVINDGSNDGSGNIIASYAKIDKRIKIINQTNQGIVVALNNGLKIANGKYIARMDCDDISLPTRFYKQVEYMEHHLDIGVCGTWIRYFGNQKAGCWKPPLDMESMRSELIFTSILAHPTVFIRKEIFDKYNLFYRNDYIHAEDYDLWIRFAKCTRLANIPEILYLYRVHEHQVTQMGRISKNYSARQLREKYISDNLGEISSDFISIHEDVASREYGNNMMFVKKAFDWFNEIIFLNSNKEAFNQNILKNQLHRYFYDICCNLSGLGVGVWLIYIKFLYKNRINITAYLNFKIFLKCIVGSIK